MSSEAHGSVLGPLQCEPLIQHWKPDSWNARPAGLSIAATRVVPIDTMGADAVIYQPEPEAVIFEPEPGA